MQLPNAYDLKDEEEGNEVERSRDKRDPEV